MTHAAIIPLSLSLPQPVHNSFYQRKPILQMNSMSDDEYFSLREIGKCSTYVVRVPPNFIVPSPDACGILCDSFTFRCSFPQFSFLFFGSRCNRWTAECHEAARDRNRLSSEEVKLEAVGVGNYFIIHRCNYVTVLCCDCSSLPCSSDSRVTWVQWVIQIESNRRRDARFGIIFRLDAFELRETSTRQTDSRDSRGWLWVALERGASLIALRQVQGWLGLNNIQLKVFHVIDPTHLVHEELGPLPTTLDFVRYEFEFNFNEAKPGRLSLDQ